MMRLARMAAVLGCLTAAGCAAGPKPPLYSALQTTGSFGYFDEDLGQDRVRIGYSAPIRRSYDFSRAERERESERLVNLAYDLALLHAAEVAERRDAASFDIAERENNVDATVDTAYAPDPIYAPWPYRHHGYYGPYPFYGPPIYADRSTELAVRVTFVAQLRRDASGAFPTADTLARLRQRYPAPAQPVAGAS